MSRLHRGHQPQLNVRVLGLEAVHGSGDLNIAPTTGIIARQAGAGPGAGHPHRRRRRQHRHGTLLPLAAIGEAAALYGVASDDHATLITILASAGILLGGLLLLGPLFIGWLKLLGPRSWIRGHAASHPHQYGQA